MTPEVSDFIPGLLDDTDNHIEVAYGHHVKPKPKGQVRIKMCDNIRDNFIATFHNVLLSPDLCDRLFSIITLIILVNTCLLCWFFIVYLRAKEKNALALPNSAQMKHAFLG